MIMIQQTIYDMIELSKVSKVPVLMMSNPGFGKTTIVNRYARDFGYNVEILIGSRHSHEDITGYYVNNGGATLTHMNPAWYDRIINSDKPTILFIDELPTAPEYVQGALLSLVCDREITVDKKLRDDTLVIAAGNYAENMPETFTLLSSIINRFCVVNITEFESQMDLLDEFLADTDTPEMNKYKEIDLSEDEKISFKNDVKKIFERMFASYHESSPKGFINLNNADLSNMFNTVPGKLYNFISPRTINYYHRMCLGCLSLGITSHKTLNTISNGLLGMATNSFKDESQYIRYREDIFNKTTDLIKKGLKRCAKKTLAFSNTVSEKISSLVMELSSYDTDEEESIFNTCVEIIKDYKKSPAEIIGTEAIDKVKAASYIGDIGNIEMLSKTLKERTFTPAAKDSMNSVIGKLDDIVYKWAYYRNAIMNEKTAWAINLSKENDAIFFNYILAGENGIMYGIILTDSMSKPNIVRINDKFGIDQYSRHKMLKANDFDETNLLIVEDGILKSVSIDWIRENADLLTSEAVKNM